MNMQFEIYKNVGKVSEPNNGWTKELNIISWNNREPVYDIRAWNYDHTEFGKGVTITQGEMKKLRDLIVDTQIF